MQTKHPCVLIHIWTKSEFKFGAPLNRFKPSSKIFYWPFHGGTSFVGCLLCLCARLFICTLWSPAGKGLTSWLSFAVSNCEFFTFPLISWVRCGTWLYRFLICAPFFTLKQLQFKVLCKKSVKNKSFAPCYDSWTFLWKMCLVCKFY